MTLPGVLTAALAPGAAFSLTATGAGVDGRAGASTTAGTGLDAGTALAGVCAVGLDGAGMETETGAAGLVVGGGGGGVAAAVATDLDSCAGAAAGSDSGRHSASRIFAGSTELLTV